MDIAGRRGRISALADPAPETCPQCNKGQPLIVGKALVCQPGNAYRKCGHKLTCDTKQASSILAR